MSFVRPELVRAFARWRDAALGATLLGLGTWWAWASFGFHRWLAVAVALAGAAILLEGLRRARFRPGSGGPGVVEVDERQVTYFGPETGGAVSIDALARVTILTKDAGLTEDAGSAQDGAHWILEEEGGGRLVIPASAAGAEQLFDALAALPGADHEAVLRAMGGAAPGRHVVWERVHRSLH